MGEEIAEKVFSDWYEQARDGDSGADDKNATLIADTLGPLAKANKLRIPRGRYLVRRGRGRVIVERPVYED